MKIGDIVRNECASEKNLHRFGIVIGKSNNHVDVLSFESKSKPHKSHYDVSQEDFLTVVGSVDLFEIIETYHRKEQK